LMVIAFQNCAPDDANQGGILSGSASQESLSYDLSDRGSIVPARSSGEEFPEDQNLPENTDIQLSFVHSHPDSRNFKWAIQRGSQFIKINEATTQGIYQTQFPNKGAYDVFVSSYKAESIIPLSQASKRLVVGDACTAIDFLEIILTSGSFTVGQTSTFGIKNQSDFSSIHWRITLPSGELVEKQNTENVTIDFSNENPGDLIVEVSAVSSDPARSECFTYRKQRFSVNDTLRPHFNPVVLKDGRNEIATFLENNEIYKYRRPQFGGNQYIETHILNAHTCHYRVSNNERSPLNCEDGLIDITVDSQDKCYERLITVWASGSSDEKASEQARKLYYNYCSEGGDYCYFGLLEKRPGYQICASSVVLASELPIYDGDPIGGQCAATHNKCQNGSPQDVVDTETHHLWQCVGIDGGTTVD